MASSTTTDPQSKRTPHRPDLSNRHLRHLVLGLCVFLLGYLIAKPWLSDLWQLPGSVVLQSAAAIGSLFLLAPFLFSLGKRSGQSTVPNRLFIVHVVASVIGIGLVGIHSLASLNGPPLVIVGCLVFLVITGVVARTRLNARMAATFGSKPRPFTAPDEATRAKIREIIDEKTVVLSQLDPNAREALFSVTLRHWITSPALSWRYYQLAEREAKLMGARQSVNRWQAYWRPAHLLLAWIFLAGLIAHVIVMTFFAGYAADGGEIYWLHITAWGG